jgi:hypothetical protein
VRVAPSCGTSFGLPAVQQARQERAALRKRGVVLAAVRRHSTRYGPEMSIAARLCVLVVTCALGASCGGGDGPTSPSAATRLELRVGLVDATLSNPSLIWYGMQFGVGPKPWPMEPGHQVTIQRAETTLFGPDGTNYHTHTHNWTRAQWVPGGHGDISGQETLLIDTNVTRPVATRYRTTVEYVIRTRSGTDDEFVTVTGDIMWQPR